MPGLDILLLWENDGGLTSDNKSVTLLRDLSVTPGWFLSNLGTFFLQKRRLRGDPVALHNSLTGGDSPGVGLWEQGTRDGMRKNGLKWPQERLKLDIWKNSFTEKVVKQWQRLPRAVFESPFLEGFQSQMCRCDTWGQGFVGLAVLG